MKRIKLTVSAAALAIICGAFVFTPPPAVAAEEGDGAIGGTCYNRDEATCYLRLGDWLIVQEGATSEEPKET